MWITYVLAIPVSYLSNNRFWLSLIYRWVLAKLLGWPAHQTMHMAKAVIHQPSQQMQLSFLKWSYSVVEFTFKIPPTCDANSFFFFFKGALNTFIHLTVVCIIETNGAKCITQMPTLLIMPQWFICLASGYIFLVIFCLNIDLRLSYWHKFVTYNS